MAFKFPFSTLHELNLDWILSKVKELVDNNEEFNDKADEAVATANEAKQIAEDAAGSVLADGSVTTSKIADYAVVQNKLAVNAVGNFQLQDGAVTASKLATDAVTTVKITDGAVSRAKIANDAINNAKLSITTKRVIEFLNGAESKDITADSGKILFTSGPSTTQAGIYILSWNGVTTMMNASAITVTMTNGVCTVTSTASTTTQLTFV